jgi:hypothetical protein
MDIISEGLEQWTEDEASPPRERLKDAKSAHALYISAREADRENAINRVTVQETVDGEPPFDQNELERSGHPETVNLNFGEMYAIIEASLSSYNDLTSSVDTLVSCHTTFGEDSDRPEWGQIIAEEWHRMNKEWGSFEFNVQYLSTKFVTHGVGVTYFDNDVDWRWRVAGLGDFLIPRDTMACEEEMDHSIAVRRYGVNQLYNFIENPDAAKAVGWNIKMVKEAIWNSFKTVQGHPDYNDWERLEEQIKNNDIYFGITSPKVRVNHYFVHEFDGTWSHKMADSDGVLEDFLYVSPIKSKRVSDYFTIFTYGIGNGYYHGIRGLAYKIFPQIQVSNRLRGKVVESAILGSSLLIQPQSAQDMEQLGLVYYGPYAVIPPNTKIIERQLPNFGQNVLPIISDLTQQIQNNTGSYVSRAVTPEGQERTKFEVQAQLQNESTLSTSAMNLFYLPWGRVQHASFRRAQNRDYQQDDPGGKAIFEMKKRILKRGVPMEAFYAVDRVEPVRAIGYGSPGNRLLALDEINNLAPHFDAVGQRNALRDRVAVRVGYETADRYVPRLQTTEPPPIDVKIAELENDALHAGRPVNVVDGEDTLIHLGSHVTDAIVTVSALNEQKVDPKDALTYFMVMFPHVQAHLNTLEGDPTQLDKAKEIQAAMQKISKVAGVLQTGLIKNAQQQQLALEKQAADQQSNGGQMSPELYQQLQEHQVQMQILKDSAQVKLGIKMDESKQRMLIRDVASAHKLAADHAAGATTAPDNIV